MAKEEQKRNKSNAKFVYCKRDYLLFWLHLFVFYLCCTLVEYSNNKLF